MLSRVDLRNKDLGLLKAVEPLRKSKDGTVWLLRCACGVTIERCANIAARLRSCGCRQGPLRHGHARRSAWTPAYRCWKNMRRRCNNPKARDYHSYGGRGIKVCERWQSFDAFLEDMGAPPPGKTLERIDNEADYEPSNCRWATWSEQAFNKRGNRLLTAYGRTQALALWAREYGLDAGTLRGRLRRGWTMEQALKPVQIPK